MSLVSRWVKKLGDAAGQAGNAVEDFFDAIAGTFQEWLESMADAAHEALREWAEAICRSGPAWLCAMANAVLGTLDGLVTVVGAILEAAFELVKITGRIVGALLRWDLSELGRAFADLFLVALILVLTVLISPLLIASAIQEFFERAALRRFVARLLRQHFTDPQELATARAAVGLTNGPFGFRLKARHFAFVLDSRSMDAAAEAAGNDADGVTTQPQPLWRWHERGWLDLYGLAGYNGSPTARTIVKYVRADGSEGGRASRGDIEQYLESRGTQSRLRVYPCTRRAARRAKRMATRKCDELGVRVMWEGGYGQFEPFRIDHLDNYRFDEGDASIILKETVLPSHSRMDHGRLVAVCSYPFMDTSTNGVAAGRVGWDSTSPCHGRSDGVCVTIEKDATPGVFYMERWPHAILRWVLAHEIGHYVGLCHRGHDTPAYVMYSKKESPNVVGASLAGLFYNGEPVFTYKDATNAWRFIVNELRTSLVPPTPPSPLPVP